MSGCSTGIEQCWQTLWILQHVPFKQVYVEEEKRKKIDRMKEVLGGSDCGVETYQSLKLRKYSVQVRLRANSIIYVQQVCTMTATADAVSRLKDL